MVGINPTAINLELATDNASGVAKDKAQGQVVRVESGSESGEAKGAGQVGESEGAKCNEQMELTNVATTGSERGARYRKRGSML